MEPASGDAVLAVAVLLDGEGTGEVVPVGLGDTVGDVVGLGAVLGLPVAIGPVLGRGVQVGAGAAWCLVPFARALGEALREVGVTPGILLCGAPGPVGTLADRLWLPPVSRLMSVTVCRSWARVKTPATTMTTAPTTASAGRTQDMAGLNRPARRLGGWLR